MRSSRSPSLDPRRAGLGRSSLHVPARCSLLLAYYYYYTYYLLQASWLEAIEPFAEADELLPWEEREARHNPI